MHQDNEQLLSDFRVLWSKMLMLNRPGRSHDQVGKDIEAGLADLEAYAQMVLAKPDFLARLTRHSMRPTA